MEASKTAFPTSRYEFDAFVLDENERSLLRDGAPVPLSPKAFETLIALVKRAGQVVSKEELIQELWPDTFVEEANLAVNISTLRKALGENPTGGQYIETLPKRGYRFAAVPRKIESDVQSPIAGHFPIIDARNATARRFSARRRLVIGLLLTLGILGGGSAYMVFSERSRVDRSTRTLAVLPFRSQRPGDESDYLGFALADSVINTLGPIKSLVVRPSSYIQKYANRDQDPREIAKELDVTTVLAGSYLKDGDDLIVNAELADVQTGAKLWSESITVRADQLLALQDYVARKVVAGLKLKLSDAERGRLDKSAAGEPLAYEYLLRSRYLLSTNNHQKAIELLTKSVELDPNSALAWAYLARAYHIDALQFSGDREEISKAEADYEQALALDPNLTQGRLMFAKLFTETGRVEQAIPLLLQVVRAEPNNAEAHWELSYAFRYGGLLAESLEEGERALKADTRLESHQFNSYLYTGQYDKFLSSLPVREDAYVIFYRGLCYLYLNDAEQAGDAFDRAYELNPSSVIVQIGKALRLAMAGKSQEGLELLKKAEAMVTRTELGDGEISYKIAQAYDALGDQPAAVRALSRAIDQGFFCYPYFVSDPLLKNIRGGGAAAAAVERARVRFEALKRSVESAK